MVASALFGMVACAFLLATMSAAQEPVAWAGGLEFHTFSIVALDPRTGESGVIVTTWNPCVGNTVPWVRAAVGAAAEVAPSPVPPGRTRVWGLSDLRLRLTE
ncbi:MAG: DUF1028 domain-containing protein [Gemmatimonadetes bacterium]|jgi:hypothetical protein|nr:DUF1028 domain-containing protein [Gemmatimonadota bacterium]